MSRTNRQSSGQMPKLARLFLEKHPGWHLASTIRRALLVIGGAAVVLLTLAQPATAHSGIQSYIYLDVTETSLSGRIEAPIPDLRTTLDLELAGSDDDVINEVNSELETITDYIKEHFVFTVEGEQLAIEFEEADLFFSDAEEVDDNYVVFPFLIDVSNDLNGDVPREFDLSADFFLAEIDSRENWLIIGNDWQAGVIDNGYETITRFTEPGASEAIDLGETSRLQNFTSSVKLGVEHIKTGPDHILFVLVLLLPSVLVFTDAWKPARGFRAALWRILKIATMFTVAHSITFTLAGLDILPLPSTRIIESIIALSIAAAAIYNLRPKLPFGSDSLPELAANREWLIAFTFGLFHGMGFASLISGLNISRSTQLVSLLGRNVGIEIGQSIVILLLFPALFLLRRTIYYRRFFVSSSLVLMVISFGWLIERSMEVDIGMSGLVDPVFEWPGVLFIIALLTAIAGGFWYQASKNDELLPIDIDLTEPLKTDEEATPVSV